MFGRGFTTPGDMIPGILGSKPSAKDLVLGPVPDASLPKGNY